jgi:hypothetical protein
LAKRHSWRQYLLHDDFYDENGNAGQPDGEVERAEEYPAPVLSEVTHDAPLLLDYSITRWHLKAEVKAAWATLSRTDILAALARRFGATCNVHIRARVLEVCATALGDFGADFVRSVWREYPVNLDFVSLTEASAACLQFSEGFNLATTVLNDPNDSRPRDVKWALGYFRSSAVLDWIEQRICPPITEGWGYLAAASQFDWPRAEKWLARGRPFSLVALDALVEIVRPRSRLGRQFAPRLGQPPSRGRFVQALSRCAEQDPVPRVQKRAEWLISNADVLTK